MICRICVFTERRLPDCNIQASRNSVTAAVNCVLHVHVFQGLLQEHVDKNFYYFINKKLVMLPGKKRKEKSSQV